MLHSEMRVYYRRFGWGKAFMTVLGVAFVLWILDYSIHVTFHSDVSANIGRKHDVASDWSSDRDDVVEAAENSVPGRARSQRKYINGVNNGDGGDQHANRPFQLPENPFKRNRLEQKDSVGLDKDVGFRRGRNGNIVFDPNSILDEFEDEEKEEKKIEIRDPKKPANKQSQEKNPQEQLGGLTKEEKEAKEARQTLLERLESVYGRVKKAKGFDDEGNFYSQGNDRVTQCEEMTRPTEEEIERQNEQWQIMDGVQHDVFLHTAYLDARDGFDDTPSIRTMLVISGVYFHGRPSCLFWYNENNEPVSVPATAVNRLSTLRRHFVNNIQYSMFMFSCKLPENLDVPDQISMVMHPCESPSNILSVVRPYEDETKHDFAVCVIGQWAQIGDVEAAFLTEWMEAYGMFGVGEINIYNVSLKVTPMVQNVIDYYTKLGRLRIVHQTAPVTALSMDDEYDASQLCLRTSANDCLLRNAFRYKHIMVIDRDELMVPRKHKTYREMVDHWFKNFPDFSTSPAITVQNTYFYMDFDPDETQPPYLATLRYRLRQPPDMPNPEHNFIPGKSVVNTKYCKIVWNHNCQLPAEPKQLAPMSTALLHHYRRGCMIASRKKDTGMKEHECEWIKFRESEDNYMLKYKDDLKQRVDSAFKDIGINSTYLSTLLENAYHK